MPVQGGNAINHGVAYAGMVADGEVSNGVSKLNKGTVNIAYGLGVVSDGDDGAKLPVAASTALQFVGVVRRELNRAYTTTDVFGAVAKRDMTVETMAPIWVTARVAVVKDDPVYLVVGDGTGAKRRCEGRRRGGEAGHQLAQHRVGIGIGRAGNRHQRSKFGIA